MIPISKPVFADVDEKTFNIHPNDVLDKITDRTKAIIGVHLFGHPFDVNAIQGICEDQNLFLILRNEKYDYGRRRDDNNRQQRDYKGMQIAQKSW